MTSKGRSLFSKCSLRSVSSDHTQSNQDILVAHHLKLMNFPLLLLLDMGCAREIVVANFIFCSATEDTSGRREKLMGKCKVFVEK